MRRRPILSSRASVSLALLLGVALVDTNAASAQQVTSDQFRERRHAGHCRGSGSRRSARMAASSRSPLAPRIWCPATPTSGPTCSSRIALSGATTRVSVTTPASRSLMAAGAPQLSANGRFVVFDTTGTVRARRHEHVRCPVSESVPCPDVYVHDRQTARTTWSASPARGRRRRATVRSVDISADGRFVLFWSAAPNLVANDTNDVADLFLRDRQTGTTTRVSVDSAGNQFAGIDRVRQDERGRPLHRLRRSW